MSRHGLQAGGRGRAEQACAADAFQRPLRSRFQALATRRCTNVQPRPRIRCMQPSRRRRAGTTSSPVMSGCPDPDGLTSQPPCEALGTRFRLCQPRRGGGRGQAGRWNAREESAYTLVHATGPKRRRGHHHQGTGAGSPHASGGDDIRSAHRGPDANRTAPHALRLLQAPRVRPRRPTSVGSRTARRGMAPRG